LAQFGNVCQSSDLKLVWSKRNWLDRFGLTTVTTAVTARDRRIFFIRRKPFLNLYKYEKVQIHEYFFPA
jgi:hypothetical protein